MANITERKRKDGTLTYLIKVHRGKDPVTKKQLTPFTTTWIPDPKWSELKTQKELNKFAVQYEEDCKNGRISTNKDTFYEYSKYVIDTKQTNGTLKIRTASRYLEFREVLKPTLGYLTLPKITTPILNKIYSDLLNTKCKNKDQNLSPKTVLEYHRFISSVLSFAVSEQRIPSNPAQYATKPRPEKKEPNYLQPETASMVLELLKQEPLKWQLATHLLILSGCRRGEIMGIPLDAINLNTGTVEIRQALLYDNRNGIYIDTTKTRKNRYVHFPEETVRLIKRYIAYRNRLKLANGDRWKETGLLFVQDDGSMPFPDSLTDWLSNFSKKHGIQHINPHALRHTFASVLIANGVDVVTTSKMLGHDNPTTTSNMYAHLIQKAQVDASNIAANIFLNSKKA